MKSNCQSSTEVGAVGMRQIYRTCLTSKVSKLYARIGSCR